MGPSSDGTGQRTRCGSLVRVPSVWPQPPGLLPVAGLRGEALFERAQHIGEGGCHTLGGSGHRLPQAVADALLGLRSRTHARPRPLLPPAPSARSRSGASEAPPHDQLQPPLPQVEEPRARLHAHRRQPAVGGRHNLHTTRMRGHVLPAYSHRRLLAQGRRAQGLAVSACLGVA